MGIVTNRRKFLALLAGGAGLASGALAAPGDPLAAGNRPANVFLLRGGVVGIFSTGMNQIGAELDRRGVDAVIQGHTSWQSVARRIVSDRERFGRSPVVLVGHSFGADAAIKVAETLERERITVNMLISLAATNPDPVPANVRRAVGYYFSEHGWGLPLAGGPGFRGKLSNRDYSGMSEIGHFNIDKQRSVQNEIMQLVLWSVGR